MQMHKGVRIDTKKNFAPAETRNKAALNITGVPFEREWLCIRIIDHRLPAAIAKVGARAAQIRQPPCSIFMYKVRRWKRMVGSRCGLDASGRVAAIFEILSAEHHHTKERARRPAFVKRQSLSR
jgi:hypothetical protein